jgi:nitroreductase
MQTAHLPSPIRCGALLTMTAIDDPRDQVPTPAAVRSQLPNGRPGHGIDATIGREALEWVVATAGRAPSIHNTQPWVWQLCGETLVLRADRARQLFVADRDGHSLLVSCGAAAELTELALRALGWTVETTLVPDPTDPDVLATFRLVTCGAPDRTAQTRVAAARTRRSERRVFGPQGLTPATLESLQVATAEPGVYTHLTTRPDESLDLAVAISRADRSERDDPAYAAEMAAWVGHRDASGDGIPASSIPLVPSDEPRHTDIPLRDFEVGIAGTQLIAAGVDEHPQMLVILTEGDGPVERLRAGRAMMSLMIDIEMAGMSSCPLSQSVDLVSFRAQLRNLMSWTGYPQMMLRLGQRPTGTPPPLTPRRAVHDVLL